MSTKEPPCGACLANWLSFTRSGTCRSNKASEFRTDHPHYTRRRIFNEQSDRQPRSRPETRLWRTGLKSEAFPHLAETLRRAGVTRNSLVSARMPEPLSDQRRPRRDPGHAISDRHDGRPPVQPRGADFGVADGSGRGKHVSRNSWRLRGAPALCVTMSISRRERSHITAAMERNTSRPIPLSRSMRTEVRPGDGGVAGCGQAAGRPAPPSQRHAA